MIIFDRMNSYKTLVDRGVVTSRHFVPSEQPRQEAALFTLCGVSSIITNHWSTRPENQLELFEKLLRISLTDGIYLGGALRKHWSDYALDVGNIEPDHEDAIAYRNKSKLLYKLNTTLYGVPIVRIV